jgi:transposase-like protein
MGRVSSFTVQKRERFLAYLERGETVSQAALQSEISRVTVNKWVREGKEADDNSDKAQFARRYEAILAGTGPVQLTRSDLVTMLEARARAGTVRAIELLLTRPWETEKKPGAEANEPKPPSFTEQLQAARSAQTDETE